ncbi:MAG: serine/threonine-protein kinase [Deltaproteobacteria bacterium]
MQPSGSSGLPTIGRYELVSGIASGGMGAVVLARLASSGGFQRLVALKLLHREHTSDPEFLAMFLDEARIAARIHHPNVVGIQEVGESPEHGYFLVMDYVEGFPLSDVVSRLGTLPLRERLRIVGRVVIDALQGLDAAHALLDDDGRSLQVVHRDVSPQNILVGVDGIGRVTDFGIARAAGRLVTTRAGEVKGKTAYLSPESVCGQPVDARSDLFSTGVVLWEAVALRRLFAARMPLDTANNVLNMEIPSLSSLVPGVPTDLDAVCLSSLSRDPAHRFRSARAFANALESALRSADLVGESHEVGAFVTGAFVEQIAERRAAVRRVAHDTIVSSGPKSFDLFEDVTAATAAKPRLLALEATKSSSPASVAVPRPPRAEASLPPSSPEQAMPAPRVTRSAPVIPVPRAAPAPPAPLVDDDDSFDRQRTTALGDNDASPAARAAIDNYRAQMLASSAARLPAAPADAPPPRERRCRRWWSSCASASARGGTSTTLGWRPRACRRLRPRHDPLREPGCSLPSRFSFR